MYCVRETLEGLLRRPFSLVSDEVGAAFGVETNCGYDSLDATGDIPIVARSWSPDAWKRRDIAV